MFIDYLEKGKTIDSEYYISLLQRLKDEIAKKKRSQFANVPLRKRVMSQVDQNFGKAA